MAVTGFDLDVPTFIQLRKSYEAKKDEMNDADLLHYLKKQHHMISQVMGASGGAVEFPEGMGPKRGSQRQSTFLQEHGGSFARKSKLSIIDFSAERQKDHTRPSFNQTIVDHSEANKGRPRKPSLSTSDEQYITPSNIDKDKADRNHVKFDDSTLFDGEGKESEADAEERKRKVRQRQATGFVSAPPSHVSFDNDTEGKESEADAEERKRKVRQRQATGFVKAPLPAEENFEEKKDEEG